MDVYEITGNVTGISRTGVNFLEPADSYQNLEDGYVYRQVLQSRLGLAYFAPRLAGQTRVMGIFEHILPDGSKQLLVADTNFLYIYNTGTGIFDQIAYGGSMAAYAGFNIIDKNWYISGTSYPDKNNNPRFVFTGFGITANAAGSSVFFYDGTNVKDYTAIADNPDYAAQISRKLNKAIWVSIFGERLNFIAPTIENIEQNQQLLFSGIKNSAGNGDKFNVAGSGYIEADTYEYLTGFTVLGQVMSLNFNRSAYTVEKTRDVFNPYFIRRTPTVLGTDAKFSAIGYDDKVRSVGKTGIVATDGRQQLRCDDKINTFTRDQIDQLEFDLTYGGFDRFNNQLMWSYKESETDSDTQNKVLIFNYEELSWSIYNLRLSVFGQCDIGLNLNWEDIDGASGNESWAQWQTTEELWGQIGLGDQVQKTLAGDDLGFIYEINKDFDDYFTNISAITQASSAVLTISSSAFQIGDEVIIEDVEGMTQINNDSSNVYTVTAASSTSITVNQDSTLFDVYTTGGSVSKVINFRAETIPFNPYRSEGYMCYVSHVEFLLDTSGGHLYVDVIADDEDFPFKQNVLLQPSNTTTKSSEWITMTVDQEANFLTFVMKQKSVSSQMKLYSMRIHTKRGALTSG